MRTGADFLKLDGGGGRGGRSLGVLVDLWLRMRGALSPLRGSFQIFFLIFLGVRSKSSVIPGI